MGAFLGSRAASPLKVQVLASRVAAIARAVSRSVSLGEYSSAKRGALAGVALDALAVGAVAVERGFEHPVSTTASARAE
jgi:hypothetical protein